MSLTLCYFPLKGAAEISRLIFAYTGEKYEDKRITSEEWKAGEKAKSPTGGQPMILLEGGEVYSQSMAIARYLANKFDLAGKSGEEKLHADMVVDAIKSDMAQSLMKAYFEKDEERKTAFAGEAKEKINTMLELLEKNCVKGDGTFLASGTSWADLMFYNFMTDVVPLANASMSAGVTLDATPKLKAIHDKVQENPNIKKWIETRPQTQF